MVGQHIRNNMHHVYNMRNKEDGILYLHSYQDCGDKGDKGKLCSPHTHTPTTRCINIMQETHKPGITRHPNYIETVCAVLTKLGQF